MKKRPLTKSLLAPLTRLTGAAALIATMSAPAIAAPLVSIGDTVDIFFRGDFTTRYHSNLFNNASNKRDDFAFVFSPGVEITASRSENANITLIFREDIVRYARTSRVNGNLANLFIDGFYKSGPATINSGFSFYQTQQNTGDINAVNVLVKRDIYRAFIDLEYDFSPKTYADVGFSWDRTDFTNLEDQYHNRDIYTIPVNMLYRLSPKLSIGGGYRYRYTSVDDTAAPLSLVGNSYEDHFISAVVRGEILPKLTARVNIGAQVRDAQAAGSSNHTTFTVNSNLRWNATPKAYVDLNFNRDFATGASGTSITRTGGDLRLTYLLSNYIQSSAVVGYTHGDYLNSPRTDKTTLAGADISYVPNSYLRFSAGYTYQNNDSNQPNQAGSFNSHIISLSASLRY